MGGRFVGDDGLDLELLIAEAGRSGGPIGLVGSVSKKLDFRLFEEGEGGICKSVSIVLSDSEGLGFRFSLDVSGWELAGSVKTPAVFPPPANNVAP
jgi:hypothetical protein